MSEEQRQFISLFGKPPARLKAEQVACLLNCQAHDVPILVQTRLLKPLGNPAPNSIKFFATEVVLELSRDQSWLSKVTNTINQHWQRKNARRKLRLAKSSQNDRQRLSEAATG